MDNERVCRSSACEAPFSGERQSVGEIVGEECIKDVWTVVVTVIDSSTKVVVTFGSLKRVGYLAVPFTEEPAPKEKVEPSGVAGAAIVCLARCPAASDY